MAKLTKRQVSTLRQILADAEAADADIQRSDVVLMSLRSAAVSTLDVTLPDGRVACEVNKHGRPFVRLDRATSDLAAFIVDNS